ncbi:hypothetical protein ABMA10_18695 [Plantibacter sp. RU18]
MTALTSKTEPATAGYTTLWGTTAALSPQANPERTPNPWTNAGPVGCGNPLGRCGRYLNVGSLQPAIPLPNRRGKYEMITTNTRLLSRAQISVRRASSPR